MKKLIIFLLCLVFLIPLLPAQQVQTLGTFKQNTDIILYQTCADCTYNNISYVSAPNLTSIISNVPMTQSGTTFSYTLVSNYTQTFGRYLVCGFGNPSSTKTSWCYDFYINGTGREEPSGMITTFFIITFLFILVFMVYSLVNTIGHGVKKDFDIVDLGFDFGIYFAVIGFYFLQQQYLGSPLMDNILYVLFYSGGFTHVFLPAVFFFISMFKASTEKTRQQLSGGVN